MDRIKPGMKVPVRVDTYPDAYLAGSILSVAPRPDEDAYRERRLKFYSTLVELEDHRLKLLPGMTATVEIDFASINTERAFPREMLLVAGP